MISWIRLLSIMFLFVLLGGCRGSKSSLDGKRKFLGNPESSQVLILIKEDGTISWKNQGSKEIILTRRDQLKPLIQKVLTDERKDNDVITLKVDKSANFDDPAFVIALVAEFNGKLVIMTEKN